MPMLAGRALQGLAMGFIPVGISFIREVAPPEMASTAVATMSATLGVGGAAHLEWRKRRNAKRREAARCVVGAVESDAEDSPNAR